MLRPRWRKVLVDLWANKARTILTVLSIAVGVMAVGSISTAYVILERDMNASFRAINPAGATLAASPFDNEFLDSLRRLPGVGEVEGRAHVSGLKLEAYGGRPLNIELRANPDYENSKLDKLILREGAWPGSRELVLEHLALSRVPVRIGDSVRILLPDGKERELRVAGFLEDRTTDGTGGTVYGYVNLDTLEYLGRSRSLNLVELAVAEQADNAAHVRAVAQQVEEQFRRNGGEISSTTVREPGKHPSASQVSGITSLLGALGLLTIGLSAFLVINTVSALMAQQVRQIGIMKALGARTGQIFGMYLVLLLCLGLGALLIAAPLALALGYIATGQIAAGLNFVVSPFRLEPLPLILMTALSLAVPVLAGLVPVAGGAATTIRAAITGYGLAGAPRPNLVDRLLGRVRSVSRPLLISLRNTVRRRARLVLTLTTLVLAGSIFIGVISTQKSMAASVTQMYSYYMADVNADFDDLKRVAQIRELLDDVPGVARVENWIFSPAEVMPVSGRAAQVGHLVATDQLTVHAPPIDSTIVNRKPTQGRWLLPEDRNAVVMCTRAMAAHPDWKIGSTVTLRLRGGVVADFVIVGTFPFASGQGNKVAIASSEYLAELFNRPGRASHFRITTSPQDRVTEDLVRNEAAARLTEAGYKVTVSSGHADRDALMPQLNMIIGFLLGLATLIGLVGGLGLAGTMTMNVMERTREIGVMRSIGATNGAIMKLVLVEGLLTGLASWVGAVLLGIPLGRLLSFILGSAIFSGTPFDFIMDWRGPFIWLAVVVVLSVVASVFPAWNASRLTIREVLAYE